MAVMRFETPSIKALAKMYVQCCCSVFTFPCAIIFEYINEQGYPQCEIADVILSRQNVNIENYKKSELIPLFPYGYDSYAKYYWQEDGSPPYFYFKWYIFEKI